MKITPSRSNRFRNVANTFGKFRPWLFVASFALIGGIATLISLADAPVQNAVIQNVTNIGNVASLPNILGRDGGSSALIGGQVTWTFGDTFYVPVKGKSFTGDMWRSSTAAIAPLSNPLAAQDTPADANGSPQQLLPYTQEELNYNVTKANANDRYTLWGSQIFPTTDGNSGLIYYQKLLIAPSGSQYFGTGIATIAAGSRQAQRLPNLLFNQSEPSFRGGTIVGDYIYLFAPNGKAVCPVARVPRSQATNRSAYTFWNGTAWDTNIAHVKDVLPASNFGYTVTYNPALRTYILAYIPSWSHTVYFSYSANFEGPWTPGVKAFDLAQTGTTNLPHFHDELYANGGRTMYMSYSHGTGVNFHGYIELLKIDLASAVAPPATPPATTGAAGASKSTSSAKSPATAKGGGTSTSAAAASAAAEKANQAQAQQTIKQAAKTHAKSRSVWEQVYDYIRTKLQRVFDYLF